MRVERYLSPRDSISLSIALVLIACFSFCGFSRAQPALVDIMGLQEEARRLEREISELEEKMAQAQKDWVTISHRLSELENCITACHMELERAEAELSDVKSRFSSRVRQLYIDGKANGLLELLSARNATDFMVKCDYMLDITESDARVFSDLKNKKEEIEERQEEIVKYKQEAARLARNCDPSGIEAQLNEKKEQLAQVNSRIIENQVPALVSPAPTNFDPSRVYTEPDESAFIRTGQVFSGYSSWYGNEFHGRPTASGEIFDQYAFTCAHRTLPMGTWLRVTFRDRSVIVKVNDRGPFIEGRILDLSRGAAEAIGLTGVQWVDCEMVIPKSS